MAIFPPTLPPILTYAHLESSISPLSYVSCIQRNLGSSGRRNDSNSSWEARLRRFVNQSQREVPFERSAFTSSLRSCFGPDKNGRTVARMQPLTGSEVGAILDAIAWDSNGLVVAIAQHIDTGAILMQGFANQDAVSATLTSGRATFYSRSRSSLWIKGETSSNFINVMDVFLDCDRDSVIYLGKPEGPACHTGAETCYFTPASDIIKGVQVRKQRLALTTLYSLEDTIGKRKDEVLETLSSSSSKSSWTQKLINDSKLLCRKIREEADELCRTLEDD
eukprot:c24973_g1_i2 orf=169-1002(+)